MADTTFAAEYAAASASVVLLAGATATANRLAIQAALDAGGAVNLGGSGVRFIDAPLVIGSNTSLTVPPGLRIKQASGANRNLIQSQAYQRSWASVSIAWASGLSATVTWTAHGRAVGDYVWVRGVATTAATSSVPSSMDSALVGIFRITSVTDANTFVVLLRRLPAAQGSATYQAKLCDVNITVSGGVWDYNKTGNNANDPLERHAIVLAGIAGLLVEKMAVTDSQKYTICVAGVRDFVIRDYRPFLTNSDGVKIYGPAFDGRVTGVHGDVHDDGISVQPREPTEFAQYDFTQGGDCLNIYAQDIKITAGLTSAAVIYLGTGFLVDDVTYDGVSFQGAGYTARIDSGDLVGTPLAGAIKLKDIEQCRPDYTAIAIGGIGSYFTIGRLEIDGFLSVYNAPTTGSLVSMIAVTANATFRYFVIKNSNIRFNRLDFGVSFAGTVDTFEAQSNNVEGVGGGGLGRFLVMQGNASTKKIVLHENRCKDLDNVLSVGTQAETPSISITNNYLSMGFGAVLSLATTANISVSGNRCMPGSMTAGFIRANGTITANIDSAGGNLIPAGKFLVKVSGNEIMNLRGIDAQVDITTVARFDGGMAYNTNASATNGTDGAIGAGLLVCVGTATGSWKRLGTAGGTGNQY